MKKYLALAITIIVFCAGSYFAERHFFSYSSSTPPLSQKSAPASSSVEASPVEKIDNLQATTNTSPNLNSAPAVPATGINFTLSVEGRPYHGSAREGATILDAMNALAATTDFRFTSKNFPGMGAFIESINGKQAAEGYNWIFYANGIKAQQGVSSTPIQAGDAIEWKYER